MKYDEYSCYISIVLDVISNLEMTNVCVDVWRFYANTVPFYLKDLITHVFWYLHGVL